MRKGIEILSAIAGAMVSFFSGLPVIVWVLIGVMSLDYATGILCGLLGRSPKTETGGLSSGAAFLGLLKKAVILSVVGLAALIDNAIAQSAGIEMAAVTGACCLWFVASEGMSILENATSIGVPVPKALLSALEIMRQKGEASGEKE